MKPITLTSLLAFQSYTRSFVAPGHPISDSLTKLNNEKITSHVRRNVFVGTMMITILPYPSNAGEVGAMITKAVTQSDLGVSVRKSVVRGAQIMDKLDGQWEKFSDDNKLGSQRSKQLPPPVAGTLPDLKPLNVSLAQAILEKSDQSFLEMCGLSSTVLDSQIKKVDDLVRKSFYRSGLDLNDDMTAREFNYYAYIHFRSYCDIIREKNLSFNRKVFENSVGEKLFPLLNPSGYVRLQKLVEEKQNMDIQSKESLTKILNTALDIVDTTLVYLVANGFVAKTERNSIDQERLQDWTDDLADLQLSIPFDGDATLNAQILLQEQGLRLYPNFSRFVIAALLRKCLEGTNQILTDEDYYMDTGYSTQSFEAKQVLLNIVIDSA